MSEESSIHGIDDTVRVAIGFVMGGFTAVHFDLGYILVAAFAAGFVFLEAVYGFAAAWYAAYKHKKQKNTQSQ